MMKALSTAMSQGDLELAKRRLKSSMEDMRQHVKVSATTHMLHAGGGGGGRGWTLRLQPFSGLHASGCRVCLALVPLRVSTRVLV